MIPQDPRALRTFGIMLAGAVCLACGIALPSLGVIQFAWWPWGIAGGLAVAAFAAPRALRPIHTAWIKMGIVLGWVNTRLLLGLIFFIVVWPMGLIRRHIGRAGIPVAGDPAVQSYRIPCKRSEDPSRFDRPY